VGRRRRRFLKAAGINTLKDLLRLSLEDLVKLEGIGEKTAEKIMTAAHAFQEKEKSKKPKVEGEKGPDEKKVESKKPKEESSPDVVSNETALPEKEVPDPKAAETEKVRRRRDQDP